MKIPFKIVLFKALVLVFILNACKSVSESDTTLSLPRSIPEAEGVSSEGILAFLEAAESSPIEFHSFMFLRHGKVIAEGWWDPYRSDLRHTLYSTSKSFTSTAVGLAVNEGLLTVNDKVISFFPDELPDTISPFLEDMTVKDLLTMTVGQDPDPTYIIPANEDNWVKAFLATPVLNNPGTQFLYNSMATYMLSAIVQQVTGEKVVDYLTPRLFEPLGISGMDWEVDPKGINTGGWGLRLKTEDLSRFGQLYLQKGQWEGTQIIPEAWVEEATTAHIDQAPDAPKAVKDSSDWMQGYCYQFWRCRNDAFRADGAYGQYILVLRDKDAVIALTAESPDLQGELNLVWEYLLPAIKEETLEENAVATERLNERLASLALEIPKNLVETDIEEVISGKTFVLDSNQKQLKTIGLTFTGEECQVVVEEKEATYNLVFGKNKWIEQETTKPGPNLLNSAKSHFEVLPYSLTAGCYAWQDDNTLELVLRYIESPHHEVFTLKLDGEQITIDIQTSFRPQVKEPVITGKMAE